MSAFRIELVPTTTTTPSQCLFKTVVNNRWSGAWLAAIASCAIFATGCATHKPIPAAYLQNPHQAGLLIKKMPTQPEMVDSGQGGLIGAIITATSRASNMKAKLAGMDGEQVREIFTCEFKRRMAEHLTVGDSTNDLRIEVRIDTWGWFVPTIDFGIKVGDYECQVVGRVDVFDTAQNKKIGYAHLRVSQPLGSKPEEISARRAVGEVAQHFAEAAENALIHLPEGR